MGQGNIFTSVCHSVHGVGGEGVCIQGGGQIPLIAYYKIQSTSGRDASYWNAFFVLKYFYSPLHSIWCFWYKNISVSSSALANINYQHVYKSTSVYDRLMSRCNDNKTKEKYCLHTLYANISPLEPFFRLIINSVSWNYVCYQNISLFSTTQLAYIYHIHIGKVCDIKTLIFLTFSFIKIKYELLSRKN